MCVCDIHTHTHARTSFVCVLFILVDTKDNKQGNNKKRCARRCPCQTIIATERINAKLHEMMQFPDVSLNFQK